MTNADFVNLMKSLPEDLEVFFLSGDGRHSTIQWAAKNDHFNLIEIKVEPVVVSMSSDRNIWVDPVLLVEGANPEELLQKEEDKKHHPLSSQLPTNLQGKGKDDPKHSHASQLPAHSHDTPQDIKLKELQAREQQKERESDKLKK